MMVLLRDSLFFKSLFFFFFFGAVKYVVSAWFAIFPQINGAWVCF